MFLGFFWMLINVFLGLFLGFAVPDESTPGRMIFFYTWAVLTLAAYVYVVWRWWRKKIDV
jgi:membrane protein DedA with SNARE-associated domain